MLHGRSRELGSDVTPSAIELAANKRALGVFSSSGGWRIALPNERHHAKNDRSLRGKEC